MKLNKKKFIKYWNVFQSQGDIWFFFAFLISLPFSIRKIIHYFPIKNTFNEYTSIYFSLSDLFFLFFIVFWLISILCNKYSHLSIFNLSPLKKLWITCVKKLKKINFNLNLSQKSFSFKNVSKKLELFTKNIFKKVSKINFSSIVPRGTITIKNVYQNDKTSFIISAFVIWSFISIFWSENSSLAFFRSLKLLEFYLIFIFIKKRLLRACPPFGAMEQLKKSNQDCSTWNIKKIIILIFIFLGVFESILAIWQFILQKSIGLTFFKESVIAPDILGVAKIILNGERYIRGYGTFPHPNILGGFLLLSIILSLFYKKNLVSEKNVPRGTSKLIKTIQYIFNSIQEKSKVLYKKIHSQIIIIWNKLKNSNKLNFEFFQKTSTHLKKKTKFIKSISWKELFHVEQLKKLWKNIVQKLKKYITLINIALAIQLIALILSFSKSAILGLIIAALYIFINNVPRGTRNAEKLFHVEQLKKLKYYFILSFLIFGVLLFYFKIDLYALFIQSIEERFIYLSVSIQAISQNLLWGLGQGQFVFEMGNYSLQNLAFWQYQPVHNVFLLILAELGMIGLFFFIWFILELFHVEHQENYSHSEFISKSQKKILIPHAGQDDNSIWNIYLKAILLGFIFIMIFDHYLWDIQQGSLMLWVVLGLIATKD